MTPATRRPHHGVAVLCGADGAERGAGDGARGAARHVAAGRHPLPAERREARRGRRLGQAHAAAGARHLPGAVPEVFAGRRRRLAAVEQGHPRFRGPGAEHGGETREQGAVLWAHAGVDGGGGADREGDDQDGGARGMRCAGAFSCTLACCAPQRKWLCECLPSFLHSQRRSRGSRRLRSSADSSPRTWIGCTCSRRRRSGERTATTLATTTGTAMTEGASQRFRIGGETRRWLGRVSSIAVWEWDARWAAGA